MTSTSKSSLSSRVEGASGTLRSVSARAFRAQAFWVSPERIALAGREGWARSVHGFAHQQRVRLGFAWGLDVHGFSAQWFCTGGRSE